MQKTMIELIAAYIQICVCLEAPNVGKKDGRKLSEAGVGVGVGDSDSVSDSDSVGVGLTFTGRSRVLEGSGSCVEVATGSTLVVTTIESSML